MYTERAEKRESFCHYLPHSDSRIIFASSGIRSTSVEIQHATVCIQLCSEVRCHHRAVHYL
jgi:hypothetical protein